MCNYKIEFLLGSKALSLSIPAYIGKVFKSQPLGEFDQSPDNAKS